MARFLRACVLVFRVLLPLPALQPKLARLLADKMVKEFTYELDEEPSDVTFNIMESVLCRLED